VEKNSESNEIKILSSDCNLTSLHDIQLFTIDLRWKRTSPSDFARLEELTNCDRNTKKCFSIQVKQYQIILWLRKMDVLVTEDRIWRTRNHAGRICVPTDIGTIKR